MPTGERRHTHSARVVFVAIDEAGHPRRVPRLVPGSPEELERYERARQYRQERRR